MLVVNKGSNAFNSLIIFFLNLGVFVKLHLG